MYCVFKIVILLQLFIDLNAIRLLLLSFNYFICVSVITAREQFIPIEGSWDNRRIGPIPKHLNIFVNLDAGIQRCYLNQRAIRRHPLARTFRLRLKMYSPLTSIAHGEWPVVCQTSVQPRASKFLSRWCWAKGLRVVLWDLMFSRRWKFTLSSSGLQFQPCRWRQRNVGIGLHPQHYTVQQPKRPQSCHSDIPVKMFSRVGYAE
jgi:hypothetical protein